jgi:hypothetical protein
MWILLAQETTEKASCWMVYGVPIVTTVVSGGFLLLVGIVTGLLSYRAGLRRAFTEQKQKAYESLLPAIIKAGLDHRRADPDEFNTALALLWLYASNNAALAMDKALTIFHHPEDYRAGESQGQALVKALQEVIAAIRDDMQQGRKDAKPPLTPEQVGHFYTYFKNLPKVDEKQPEDGLRS